MRKMYQVCGVLIAIMAGASPALAADPSELGKSLTPFGAEKGGSADGAIPAWDGGITKPPAGYQPGQPNFSAIQGWNAAGVYQQAIAIIGRQIDG